jgi:putative FmdB family regulatory protein
MPIYEYVCGDCSQRFETLVRAWGDAVACPSCQSPSVEKQLSTFAVSSAASAPDCPQAGSCRYQEGGCGCR